MDMGPGLGEERGEVVEEEEEEAEVEVEEVEAEVGTVAAALGGDFALVLLVDASLDAINSSIRLIA